ncbi:uncharacterized protein L201_001748 [Kwoniella dendrophila CBS 6074]|uniref:Phosphatidate cytidylyltransferase, mitochondrial n=1 Tax=Kwoniella dendrophila CBS 6074 TaxID=1295534 RepID=A0AAX4JPQ6_9TREE
MALVAPRQGYTGLRGLQTLVSSIGTSRSFTSFPVYTRRKSPVVGNFVVSTSRRPNDVHLAISIRIGVRYNSSVVSKKSALPPDQQLSYDRLRPIVDDFEAPMDWAVAYGSGVMKQAQVKPGDPPSLTDLLLSTSSPVEFHTINLRQNPSHYPLHARLMGPGGIAHVQENRGAGVWYVTDVKVNGISVKYGIISTSTLIQDLNEWRTFYLSGRLHKPTLPLILPNSTSELKGEGEAAEEGERLIKALENNLISALSLALILCPEEFEEDYLWEKIAGLSYSGDPRMSIPGGENPEKVKNIVKGPGARDGFRSMYGAYLNEKGVSWVNGEKEVYVNGQNWIGDGDGLLRQPFTPEHQLALSNSLPLSLRQKVSTHLNNQDQISFNEKTQDLTIKNIQDPKFRSILSTELRNIIHKPALRQSIKGLYTAGFTKSFWYALAKIRKWFKGRGNK